MDRIDCNSNRINEWFILQPKNGLNINSFELLAPTLQKSESFSAKASKGAAVVDLLQALGNAGYEVLRLSLRFTMG